MSADQESRPGLSLWQVIGLILLLAAGVAVYQFFASLRGPTHNGMTVREWLVSANVGGGFNDPKFAADVLGFGPESIPVFVRALGWATNQPKEFDWFGLKKTKSGGPPHGDPRYGRAVSALVVLGRKYSEQVDPVFFDMMKGGQRHNAIVYLGYMGNRHFGVLTNLLTSNKYDGVAALSGLAGMKTNAEAAVSVIVSELHRRWLGDEMWHANAAFTLGEIGGHHPLTLPVLFQGVQSTNKRVHTSSAFALGRMTNRFDEIRPFYLGLAQQPVGFTNGFNNGGRPAVALKRIGVPPEVGVPILTRRLKDWMALERGKPFPGMVLYTLRALAEYGSDAGEVRAMIEDETLAELRQLADAADHGSIVQSQAENAIQMAERELKRIDP